MSVTQIKNGFNGGTDDQLKVNTDGSINVNASVTPSGTQNVNLTQVGGSAIALGQTTMSASLPIAIASNQSALAVTGTFFQSVQPVSQSGTWTTGRTWTLNSGTDSVTVSGSLTPSGTQNVNLTQVGGSSFSLGQQLAAASLPIVLTVSQLSTLTPLSTVAVTQSTNPWTVSGTVAVSSVSGNVTVVQPTGSSLHTNIDNFPATQAVTQSTSPWVTSTSDGSITGTINGSGQTVTLMLPSGTSSTEIQLAGTLVGTLNFESTIDGTTFNPRVYRSSGILNNLQTQTTTIPSEWRGNSSGMTQVRVRCSTYTSGTATITIRSSMGTGAIFLNAAVPIGEQSTSNSSTASIPASSSFTGVFEDMTQVSSIDIALMMSQNGTLHTQFSQDGSTIFLDITYAVTANVGFQITLPPAGTQFFRVKVDNSSSSTTSTVALNTGYSAVAEDVVRLALGSAGILNDSILAPINRSVLTGRSASGGGTYVDVSVTPSGVLNVAATQNTSPWVVSGTVTANNPPLPTSGYTGQSTLAVANTAQQITGTSSPLTIGVIIQALSTNAASVYIGFSGVSTSTGFELQPGQATSMAISNLNLIYLNGTNVGDGVCWVGS